MFITCNNRECQKETEALLDVATQDVICAECGKVITNITKAMKLALKSCGQIVRQTKKAFCLDCPQCKAGREVIYDKSTNKVLCKVCGTEVNVHPAMKQAIMECQKPSE